MGCILSAPPSKVIVVGASGSIGKATLKALDSRHGAKVDVYAGTRDPSKWEAMPRVTAAKTDMNDKKGLAAALKGFDRAFIVIPSSSDRTQLGINALEAAKEAGVQFVLLLSVLTAEMDNIFGEQFKPLEAKVKELQIPYAIIRLPLFIDNMYMSAKSIKEQGTFYDPRDPTKAHTPVAVSDVGKAAADILAKPDEHHGKTYKLVMQPFTLNELAAEFTKALGKTVKPTTAHYNEAKEAFMGNGLPEWQVDGIMELFRLVDDGSKVTNESHTGDIQAITKENAMTMKDWVWQNAAGFK